MATYVLQQPSRSAFHETNQGERKVMKEKNLGITAEKVRVVNPPIVGAT